MTLSRVGGRDRQRPERCAWCARALPRPVPGAGRPRRWCRPSCRQRAYEARSRDRVDDEIVDARRELATTQDHLWALARALDDVERDLASPQTAASLRQSLDWLRDAARAAVSDPS